MIVLFISCTIFWGALFATLYIHLKQNPTVRAIHLPYPECTDGRCVPATLENLFNDEFFKKYPASPIGYSMLDASRWVEEYSEGAFALPTIVATEYVGPLRFKNHSIIKKLTRELHQPHLKNTKSKYAILVLSVLRGTKKHCVGVVWDVFSGECWVVDPATKFVDKKQILQIFTLELVEEVGMVMMGVNVVALFAQQNLPHIVKTIKPLITEGETLLNKTQQNKTK